MDLQSKMTAKKRALSCSGSGMLKRIVSEQLKDDKSGLQGHPQEILVEVPCHSVRIRVGVQDLGVGLGLGLGCKVWVGVTAEGYVGV